jgi:uncharacterized protein YcbK (DUF882 family)
MGDLTKDFNRSEYACKCGCGFDAISPNLTHIVQKIRDALGAPIHINSGCRCEERNKAAGGVPNSTHLKGVAADLWSRRGSQGLFEVIKTLHAQGKIKNLRYCKRYIAKNFVHIDCGPVRKRGIFQVG